MYGTENVDPPLTGETAWPLPPWAADAEMAIREKIHPAAGCSEKADTAPAGLNDDDTLEMPPVAGFTGGQHLAPQPAGQTVGDLVPVRNSAKKRRLRSRAKRRLNRRMRLKRLALTLLVLVVLVILNVVLLDLLLLRTQ
jgi:hypothetical protein